MRYRLHIQQNSVLHLKNWLIATAISGCFSAKGDKPTLPPGRLPVYSAPPYHLPCSLSIMRAVGPLKIIRHPRSLPSSLRGSVAALGNFDGFHLGHQVVVGEAGRIARDMGAALTVITTEPHPRSFFRPDDAPFRLTPFRERALLMREFGVDLLVSMPFNRTMSQCLAQDFVTDILCRELGLLHIVVGYDYRFGKGRGGGVTVLARMGEMEGFGLSVVEPVAVSDSSDPEIYSSSLVRDILRSGDVRKAADLLGHWWSISGRVRHGEKRGRSIGYPTANLGMANGLHPRYGVYAVRVVFDGEDRVYEGVANLGLRPTFGAGTALLEVHLFDFSGDLYGRHARVDCVDFIRPEQTFRGLEALKAAIVKDCARARERLAAPENARSVFPPPRLNTYLARHPNALAFLR